MTDKIKNTVIEKIKNMAYGYVFTLLYRKFCVSFVSK